MVVVETLETETRSAEELRNRAEELKKQANKLASEAFAKLDRLKGKIFYIYFMYMI